MIATNTSATASPGRSAQGGRRNKISKVVALCKRRGIVYPGSDIYGGLANTWDYGPLGVELKNNIKRRWWRRFVHLRPDIVGLDAGILMHRRVWEASGHVENFTDPLVDCRSCNRRFRADQLIEQTLGRPTDGLSLDAMTSLLTEAGAKCPTCDSASLTEARRFNLMFETRIGPVAESGTQVYLRPETAQAMFVQYKNILQSSRVKLPFGIAQIGKAFRNEITPGDFIYRLIEFEQMEIEYFVRPEEAAAEHEAWIAAMREWTAEIGLSADHLRVREHGKEELSHYSSRTVDFEYDFGGAMGWKELYGLANRTNFDLTRHQEFSGQDLSYPDPDTGTRFIPHVIEPTFGVDRTVLVLLLGAYDEEELIDANGQPDLRIVLRLSPRIAPIKAAILPLMKKPELINVARALKTSLEAELDVLIDYDESGNIGRRYRRQDEVGTPYCITVDQESLEDLAVTVRNRDTMVQKRIAVEDVAAYLRQHIC